jgi:hypothetical protein
MKVGKIIFGNDILNISEWTYLLNSPQIYSFNKQNQILVFNSE